MPVKGPWWEAFARFPLSPERGIRLLEGVLVIALAVTAAGLTWEALPDPGNRSIAPATGASEPEGAAPEGAATAAEGASGPRVDQALGRLFGRYQEPESAAVQQEVEAVRETELDLTLRGVIRRGGDQRWAIIATPDGERVYRVGDTVAEEAEVVRIGSQGLVLRRNGVHESLKLPKAELPEGSGRPSSGQASEGTRAPNADSGSPVPRGRVREPRTRPD